MQLQGSFRILEQRFRNRLPDLTEEVVWTRLGVAVAEQKRFCGNVPDRAGRAEA